MTPATLLRLALILAGVLAFAYSLQSGNATARWIAIGCVAGALLLRLVARLSGRN